MIFVLAFRRARPPVLLLFAVLVPATWAPGQIPLTPVALYDRHVIFQDSLSVAACHETSGAFVAPSRLDLLDGKLPLAHDRSVSPPSSLRLSWRSAAGGDWRARISVPSRYGRRFDFDGDSLSLWCRAEQEIGETAAPQDPRRL